MIDGLNTDVHAVIFESQEALFTRDDVAKIILENMSPYDSDSINYVGIFELKDGRFGSIQCKFDPSNTESSGHKFLVAFNKDEIINKTLTKKEQEVLVAYHFSH